MAATTFEPSRDVAIVGAVFPVLVPISGEGLTTTGASEIVYGFLIQKLRVRVPPLFTAFPGAEHPRFLLFCLYKRHSAFTANRKRGICGGSVLRSREVISAAVALDGIFRDAKSLADFCIGRTCRAEFCYFLFLLIGHEDSSNPRIPILMVKQKMAVGIEGIKAKSL